MPIPAPNRRRYSEDRLLDAALAVFGERGYRAAQMSEIAVAADTTKQTLYARLGSKEALYLKVLEREVQRLKAMLLAAYTEAASLPLQELIGESMGAFFRYAADHPSAFAVLFRTDHGGPGFEIRERTREELIGYISEMAGARIARAGERAPGPSTRLLAAATIGVSMQICEYAVAHGYDLTQAEAVASAYTEAAMRGIDVRALAAVDADPHFPDPRGAATR